MANYHQSDSKLIEAAQTASYTLSINEDLQQQMEAYGFTKEQAQQGITWLNEVQNILKTRDQHNDAARELSLKINQDIDTAYDIFRKHVSIVKTAFREEPHVIQSLNIQKVLNKKWKWVPQALYFYEKVPMHMEKLQHFGADEHWQQNHAATGALMAIKVQRLKKKADSEHSTQVKDQAMEALKAWYADFRRIARTAFHHTPQVLESFGIVVPSSRNKRTKATTPKATPTGDNAGKLM